MGAVLPLLDESDQEQLRAQLEDVTGQYKSHVFDSEAYLSERWLEEKEAELDAMGLTAVQPSLVQDQLREVQDFLAQVDKYRPSMDQLSSLAASADPTGEAALSTTDKELQDRYEGLKALGGERQALLADYLPSVQQYESSRGAWQDLLCGWEEKVGQLPPPLATPTAIQAQLQNIKVQCCCYCCLLLLLLYSCICAFACQMMWVALHCCCSIVVACCLVVTVPLLLYIACALFASCLCMLHVAWL